MTLLEGLGTICRKYLGTLLQMSGRLLGKAQPRQRENDRYCQDAPSLAPVTVAFMGKPDRGRQDRELWVSLTLRDL